MIYITSSTIKSNKIGDSVRELALNGFNNIELSGGTEFYDGFEDELLDLKKEFNLNYLCHNYFPPPKEHFVLNLASLNDDIYEKSLEHFVKALNLSKKLGAKRYGLHAGFFIDIKVDEIGKKISLSRLFDKDNAKVRFCEALKSLQNEFCDIDIFVENNVFSNTNFNTYAGNNIFMLTNSDEYFELKNEIDFNLLLDVAHLKVSSNSLNLDFKKELSTLIKESHYLHLSDNNGYEDQNNYFSIDSFIASLTKDELYNKSLTLEIYDSLENVKISENITKRIIDDNK